MATPATVCADAAADPAADRTRCQSFVSVAPCGLGAGHGGDRWPGSPAFGQCDDAYRVGPGGDKGGGGAAFSERRARRRRRRVSNRLVLHTTYVALLRTVY